MPEHAPDTVARAVDNPNTEFERSDWPVGTIGLVLLGIMVFVIVAPLVLLAVYPSSASDVARNVRVEPPRPRLEVNPPQDLVNFEAGEHRRLDSYYWIDKPNGVVHIPITQAMRMLAEKGIDGFPKATP